MIYEQIVRAWNAQADEHNQYDTLSDRERIEFALSLAGEVEKQESVAWVEVIDSHEGPYYFHGKELLDVGKHSLYTAPQPCQECEKLKSEHAKSEAAWATGIDAAPSKEKACSTHPDAPHGFDRTASHSLGRYVCICEGWEPSA